MAKKKTQKVEKEVSNNELATMIKHGFDSLQAALFRVETELADFKDETGTRFGRLENRMVTLEVGQDRIEERLTNVAYRFEVEDLNKRVKVLEKRR